MGLRPLSREDALHCVAADFGLANTEDVSVEFVAASLRRAAGLMCPTTPRALVNAVHQSLSLLQPDDTLRERCRETLEAMVAHGDLMEFDEIDQPLAASAGQARLIYATPPCFVRLTDTRLLVIGITPDAIDALPPDVTTTYRGVLRELSTVDKAALPSHLRLAGMHELSYDVWAKAPVRQASKDVVQRFEQALDLARPCGALDELQILNTAVRSPWYRDRWTEPRGLSGHYIARRPRRFGVDLWSYVVLQDGEPQRLVDLPLGQTAERGCDQAWRLQCAIDAESGEPQTYQLTHETNDTVRLDIHLPCPAWLLRRWESIGARVDESVFSFRFTENDVAGEANLLEARLWMRQAS